MISLTTKSFTYQIAMILFFIPFFLTDIVKIRYFLISAYLTLILWEYLTFKTITIDVVIWTIAFVIANLIKIHQVDD